MGFFYRESEIIRQLAAGAEADDSYLKNPSRAWGQEWCWQTEWGSRELKEQKPGERQALLSSGK